MDNITYIPQNSNLYQTATVGQTDTVLDSADIQNTSYYISSRNNRNYYEIPIDLTKVYLNFVAKKTLILDSSLKRITHIDFTYFVDEINPEEELILPLTNGMIFRCLGSGLMNLRDYTYYLYEDNKAMQIPDYQTLEVMLTERGVSYSTIRVLSQNECALAPSKGMLPSRMGEWTNDLGDSTGFTTLSQLSANLTSLNAITAALTNSVETEQTNINNQLAAQAAAMAASAAAAEAQATAAAAANTQAQAALAAANASAASAQAQADAAAAALAANSGVTP